MAQKKEENGECEEENAPKQEGELRAKQQQHASHKWTDDGSRIEGHIEPRKRFDPDCLHLSAHESLSGCVIKSSSRPGTKRAYQQEWEGLKKEVAQIPETLKQGTKNNHANRTGSIPKRSSEERQGACTDHIHTQHGANLPRRLMKCRAEIDSQKREDRKEANIH